VTERKKGRESDTARNRVKKFKVCHADVLHIHVQIPAPAVSSPVINFVTSAVRGGLLRLSLESTPLEVYRYVQVAPEIDGCRDRSDEFTPSR
jgi:hypothetical protein